MRTRRTMATKTSVSCRLEPLPLTLALDRLAMMSWLVLSAWLWCSLRLIFRRCYWRCFLRPLRRCRTFGLFVLAVVVVFWLLPLMVFLLLFLERFYKLFFIIFYKIMNKIILLKPYRNRKSYYVLIWFSNEYSRKFEFKFFFIKKFVMLISISTFDGLSITFIYWYTTKKPIKNFDCKLN